MLVVKPYLILPYCSSGSSAWNVPNILSQIIKNMPMFMSRYLGLLAWCTLWCEGVTIKYSSQPILFTNSVWTKMPQICVAEYMNAILMGENPNHANGIK